MSFESRLANKNSADFAVMLHRLENLLPYISSEPMVALSQYPDSSWAEWIALRLLQDVAETERFVDMTVTGSGNDVPAQLYDVEPPLTGYMITSNGMDTWLAAIGVPYTRSQLYDMSLSRNHIGAFYKACYTILDNVAWMVEGVSSTNSLIYRGSASFSDVCDNETERAALRAATVPPWEWVTWDVAVMSQRVTQMRADIHEPNPVDTYTVKKYNTLNVVDFVPRYGWTFSQNCYFSVLYREPVSIGGSSWPDPTVSLYDNFGDSDVPGSPGYVLFQGSGGSGNVYSLRPISQSAPLEADFEFIDNGTTRVKGWQAVGGDSRFFVKLDLDE